MEVFDKYELPLLLFTIIFEVIRPNRKKGFRGAKRRDKIICR